jgi:chorismate synthase
MLQFKSAGESHGKCLVGILEGLPAGLALDAGYINAQLRRRQQGHGRGGRMRIEKDAIEFTAGVRHGRTLGSPVAFIIANRDWENWQAAMSAEAVADGTEMRSLSRPRPGHADLAGALKYQTHELRDVLERASARETAARVAAGAICRLLLSRVAVEIGSHVLAIGREGVGSSCRALSGDQILRIHAESPVRCADPEAEARMVQAINSARKAGESLGGVVEVVATGVPPGLGSYAQWDLRLDGLIGQALLSIPSAKAVEIGSGITAAECYGSEVHDEIFFDEAAHRFCRRTNRAGGMEAGVSNGEEIRLRVYFKPIPTLRKPLRSVDLITKKAAEASYERSDICVAPAAGVVAEAMLAFVLARAFLEKFSGDTMGEIEASFGRFQRMLAQF